MKPQITVLELGEADGAEPLQRSCGMKPQITGSRWLVLVQPMRLQRSCGMKPQITQEAQEKIAQDI